MNLLLIGVRETVIRDAEQELHAPDVQVLILATAERPLANVVDDLRSTIARTRVDHVIVGGGVDLETRVAIVRELFVSSDTATTTVHMKNRFPGPEAFLPFVRSVVRGLEDLPPGR